MIHFSEFSAAAEIYEKYNISKIIVPIASDTMADCSLYRTITSKYPDVDAKFVGIVRGKTFKPGEYIKIQAESGHSLYFIIIRSVEKFQPYLWDIMTALQHVVTSIRSDISNTSASRCTVLFPLPSSDELKISDTIFIPAIANAMNTRDFDVYALTSCDYEQYIENISDSLILYKRDSWKSDWMLSPDDIRFINILSLIIPMAHDFRISKSNLVKCYYICSLNGMYPKLEFYDTEYGKFFRMFLTKSNSLINHGLLLNTHHYSNTEPKKFSCILGPMVPYLNILAYSQLRANQEQDVVIAQAIIQDYRDSFKNKAETSDSQPRPSYQKPETGSSSTSFSF